MPRLQPAPHRLLFIGLLPLIACAGDDKSDDSGAADAGSTAFSELGAGFLSELTTCEDAESTLQWVMVDVGACTDLREGDSRCDEADPDVPYAFSVHADQGSEVLGTLVPSGIFEGHLRVGVVLEDEALWDDDYWIRVTAGNGDELWLRVETVHAFTATATHEGDLSQRFDWSPDGTDWRIYVSQRFQGQGSNSVTGLFSEVGYQPDDGSYTYTPEGEAAEYQDRVWPPTDLRLSKSPRDANGDLRGDFEADNAAALRQAGLVTLQPSQLHMVFDLNGAQDEVEDYQSCASYLAHLTR